MAAGTKDDPWELTTAPGSSQYAMYRDGDELVCQVGTTTLKYQARAIDDLHAWLREQGDWVPLGAADEKKEPAAGGGMYLPPLLEQLGLVKLTHDARNNSVRAV